VLYRLFRQELAIEDIHPSSGDSARGHIVRKTASHSLEVGDLEVNALKGIACLLFHCAAGLRRMSPESEETADLLEGETQDPEPGE